MTSDQLLQKIKQGENETFELKAEVRDTLLLSKLISSFANNNGGQIVIGVREPIEIIGTDTNRLLTLVDQTRTVLKPTPIFNTEIIAVDNKEVFIINVDKSPEIIFSAGSVFQRIGEQIRPMTAEEIKSKLTGISSNDKSLETLAIAIEKQSKTIDELREEIKISNSWKAKLKDHLVSGIIGALIGLALPRLLT